MKKLLFSIGVMWALVVFISIPLTFSQVGKEAPVKKDSQKDVATDSNQYIIGPEDVLSIHVWREEAFSKTVPVRMDGKISLPLIDEIQAAGLTPLQLKEGLIQKLKEFVDDPVISVIVTEANSYKVFVSGYVKSPGVYRLRSETSLLQLIPMVGGFTEWANQQKIIIIRKENGKEKRMTVNYRKIVQGEDLASNLILKAGDTIIVP
ncbi:MAG: polysaccharide biosynthesis/export family protein [Thermodesulfobacteriota bacterium]|nr:polysaccharide biosynthesis/export family protein [Thermodesulfobacteriota bacterium]